MNAPLNLTDLKREPQFHLDELLEVLATVPDGYDTKRTNPETWEAEIANGYTVTIQPEYACGFAEVGDGKLLTLVTQRLGETHGVFTLTTRQGQRKPDQYSAAPYPVTTWAASVTLGDELPWVIAEPNHRAGREGAGEAEEAGTAALIAYLRAWGVLA